MVMIDAQTVRGGRTIGTKRSILIDILGLPLAVRVVPAKPHDVKVGRDLISDNLAELPNVAAIVAYCGYRGLANLAAQAPDPRHQDSAEGDQVTAGVAHQRRRRPARPARARPRRPHERLTRS